MPLTTFIIPSTGRPSLQRAVDSARATGAEVLFEIDRASEGRSVVRNRLIQLATTPWVSFLDDDDTVYAEYVDKLKLEIKNHPEADIIHFREYFDTGLVFPSWPMVEWGNVGISFSVKRDLALQHPFIEQEHEDFHFVKNLVDLGYKIHFSKFLVYKARH